MDRDAPQRDTVLATVSAGELDGFIGNEISLCGDIAVRKHFEDRVAGRTANEVDALQGPLRKTRKVHIGTIGNDDRLTGNGDGTGNANVGSFGWGDQYETRHEIIVIEQDMRLHPTFDSFEPGPGEKAQTERDGGGVQRQQLVLETKPSRPGSQ